MARLRRFEEEETEEVVTWTVIAILIMAILLYVKLSNSGSMAHALGGPLLHSQATGSLQTSGSLEPF